MSVVDQVKERLDIVEVVQTYVPLTKAGRNYKGLCPFHAEKTPSFVVFPETGTWHCFGACGTGGDVFTFIQKRENLDFGDALKLLAQRAGVELQPASPAAARAQERLDFLRDIVQAAATYFHHLLFNADEAARARAYLEERGLARETLERFEIGYALDRWDGLLRYLSTRGYNAEDLLDVGLVIQRDDGSGYYDRFRGRVIYPLRDERGRPVGFAGRVLGDGQPKYLNSPQTPLFDKSSVLFGLDRARAGIRTADEAVIVEGYMDVLMAHQHGIDNVVAQMGTALTEAQLGLLKKHTKRFVLALDSDTAGESATLRGLDVARQSMDREAVPVPTARGLIRFEERLAAEIRIATLPKGLDPDEVIRQSPARWVQLIAAARPVLDFYFDVLTADLDLATARGKSTAVQRLGPLVKDLSDRVQRAHYVQQLARMVQMDDRGLWEQLGGGQRRAAPPARRAIGEPERGKQAPGRQEMDEHCLSILLARPQMVGRVDLALAEAGEGAFHGDELRRPEDRAILQAWRTWIAGGGAQEARGEFYDTLGEELQQRLNALLARQAGVPEIVDELLFGDLLDTVMRVRIQSLHRQVRETHFLLQDEGKEARVIYAPQIKQAKERIHRLEQAINERSLSGRRRQHDAEVRVVHEAG
ncbi:MAG TPA: DNA primase [Anaerolineae bacterium]|nr:DNA primase [Anaerolineae bacterium]